MKGYRKTTAMLLATAMFTGLLPLSALPAKVDAAIFGDVNDDNSVDRKDVDALLAFLQGKDVGIGGCDLNYDNIVTVSDLTTLKQLLLSVEPPENRPMLKINEVCSTNKDSYKASDGTSPDWVELKNIGDTAADLSGIGLSDGEKNAFKFTFPSGATLEPGGYCLILCDDQNLTAPEYHAPFKISAAGETIYLTAPDGTALDSVVVPELETDITYGRYQDGSSNFAFLKPTPNASNDTAEVAGRVMEPVFSEIGGFYDEEFTLTLSDESRNEIYYTTDGSDPRTSDTAVLYTSGIRIYNNKSEPNVYSALTDITTIEHKPPKGNVEKGIVVRAVAKTPEGVFSEVEHNSYFVGKTDSYFKEMKVISMATDSDYLFDPVDGLYMVGPQYYEWLNSPEYKDYDPADPRNPTNYNKDGRESEFPVSIQVIEDGKAVYTAELGAKISGNYSRVRPQKSFRLVTRSEFGDSAIKYELFEGLKDGYGKKLDRFDKVTLWNGGNDYPYLHFRDAFVQELAADLNVETMASEPCILFIDGEFWGFYLIRERVDAQHLEYHYGLSEDQVAVIKNGSLDDGTTQDFNEFEQFCKWSLSADFTNPENYKKFCDTIDVGSFIDYMAVETYINNNDWASGYMNNWQVWKSKTVLPDIPRANGKWHFVFYDTDMCAGLYECIETLASYDSLSKNDPLTKTFNLPGMLRNLTKNDEFRQLFYDRYLYIIETTFAPERVNALLSEYISAYETVTIDTFNRFGAGWAAANYSDEVRIITDFFNARPDYAKRYLAAYCGM